MQPLTYLCSRGAPAVPRRRIIMHSFCMVIHFNTPGRVIAYLFTKPHNHPVANSQENVMNDQTKCTKMQIKTLHFIRQGAIIRVSKGREHRDGKATPRKQKIKNLLTNTKQRDIIKPRGEGNASSTKPKQDIKERMMFNGRQKN